MRISRTSRADARVSRPDMEEYHLNATERRISGETNETRLELWWDDQPGIVPGWCVRVVRYGIAGGRTEQYVPVRGRRGSKWETILRNVAAALSA